MHLFRIWGQLLFLNRKKIVHKFDDIKETQDMLAISPSFFFIYNIWDYAVHKYWQFYWKIIMHYNFPTMPDCRKYFNLKLVFLIVRFYCGCNTSTTIMFNEVLNSIVIFNWTLLSYSEKPLLFLEAAYKRVRLMKSILKRACCKWEHNVFKETDRELVWIECKKQEDGGKNGKIGTTRRHWVGLKRIITLDKLALWAYYTSNIWLYSIHELE